MLALVASSLSAQDPPRVLAFGDSITTGFGDVGVLCPTSDVGGYPERLAALLAARGFDAELVNLGLCGETTEEALSRIDSVTAMDGDILVLMEGTNDFNDFISLDTVRANLRELARRSRQAGFQTVVASVLPRRPDCGPNNELRTLALALSVSAGVTGDIFADPFSTFVAIPNVFESLYVDPWHPGPVGYDRLADVFVLPLQVAIQRAIFADGGDCLLPPGDARYCTICGPCRQGEGDCDGDGECRSGLRCADDVGPQFGFGGGTDVCVADDSTGGGDPPPPPPSPPPPDPGTCPHPPGHPRFCTDCGPCDAGQGDCDRDDECAPGLTCTDNVGAQFGFAPGIDICLDGVSTPFPPPDPGTCPLPAGHPRFCTDCGPCAGGQGDCDRDTDCLAGLVCTDNVGAQFGFAPGIDVCLDDTGSVPPPDPGTCPLPAGHPRFCTDCGPCASGQGDCDSDADCVVGLVCADNVGPTFGFGPAVDVCVAP